MLKETELRLTAFATNVVSQARNNLTSTGKAGELSNSLRYEIKYNQGNVEIIFLATDYGKFVDKGVQGANPSKLPPRSKWFGVNKAPLSPFRFGSGSGRKGGLRGAIDSWVIKKPIMDARNKKGEFIPRKSLVFMISRSIYLSGIKATQFFTKPFDNMKNEVVKELEFALRKDIEQTIFKNNGK